MQLFALFRLAFASAPSLQLNLAAYGNSQDRSTKSTLSGLTCAIALQLFVSTRFQVLFHSPPGVLFTFPSRYWFTIGRQVVFSLGRWSSLLPTGFLVSRGTLDPIRSLCPFAYKTFTSCGALSHVLRLEQSFVTPLGWSATPIRSLREREVRCVIREARSFFPAFRLLLLITLASCMWWYDGFCRSFTHSRIFYFLEQLSFPHPTSRFPHPTLSKRAYRFGLFPFRSPLLRESMIFSLPPGT
jgi:hypothetical protein